MKHKRVTSAALRAAILLALLLPIGKVWGQTYDCTGPISSAEQLANCLEGSPGTFKIIRDIDFADYSTTNNYIISAFSGTLEAEINPATNMPYKILNLKKPLFNNLTGTVKNLVLEGVNITGDDNSNTGAIAGVASGAARIYNVGILSGSVGGGTYVGGLVGKLEGTARVINCYSYANITGGDTVAGIVGYNSLESKASNIRTMVMNCMFYGDITRGNTVAPVYGGKNINNLQGGLNTFNYYSYENLHTMTITSNMYNCALAVEEKYLNRFEFYRLLLNSNKKLAAFYATGNVANADKMLKWVLETADKSNATPKPYPVLKKQGYYPSIINYDTVNLENYTEEHRNEGRKTGTLSVTINAPRNWSNCPDSAKLLDANRNEITTDRTITLVRTDKDFDRFNYNYDKVQLPYYNDYGTKNYTAYRAVTGWKIVSMSTPEGYVDPYTSANYDYTQTYASTPTYFDYPNYNFADRKSVNKDLYTVTGRIFPQGAYFDVPYGVTSITIEPYWGKAVYLSDPNYDVVYKSDYTGMQNVSQTGVQVQTSSPRTDFHGQRIETSITDARDYIANNLGGFGSTVYDNAIVLVGNYHQNAVPNNVSSKPYTLMSVDEDNDHEPDYSFIYHHTGKKGIAPIRFDFLNVIGTAQAQKPNGASNICNTAILHPIGWFEITNTSLMYFSQLEYEDKVDNANMLDHSPLILQGGVIEQLVSANKDPHNGKTIYVHLGGNVWFKEFNIGIHGDGSNATPHVPVSVTGGDYNSFYLTGIYNPNANVKSDNAVCYISGGHFGEAAGAGQEQINGNVRWQIYNADIDNFFGGGINDNKPILGTVTTDIYNSHVTLFCGGPKFGNMQTGKDVTTNAEGCEFGTFFGAGYGGNSYARVKYYDKASTDVNWSSWDDKYVGDRGKYFDGQTTNSITATYGKKGKGVATDFDYEFFVWSSGQTGGRFYVKFASFSLAECINVESQLDSCHILGNFYGGGSLGKVSGTVTSELEDCTVDGNVFGAGFSATLPTIWVRDGGFAQNPKYNSNSGMFEPAEFSDSTEFHWKKVNSLSDNTAGVDESGETKYIYTTVDLDSLGTIKRAVTLTLKGNTTVGTLEGTGSNQTLKAGTGNVYGGGEESSVGGNATVHLQGNTKVYGDVFGGGYQGAVGGETKVLIEETSVTP